MITSQKNAEFRILGPLEVWHRGHKLELGQRRERLVLGILLLEAGQLVPLERLIRLAWHRQEPPRTAKNAIQVCISHLRTALDQTATIASTGAAYRIEVDRSLIDIHRFKAWVMEARGLPEAAKAAMLRQAEALWRGPILAGTFGPEIRQDLCAGLDEHRIAAIEERIETELGLHLHADLLAELSDLTQTHPTRERLVGQLMTALHRAGRRSDALELYRITRRRLVNDLGVEPGAALQELHRGLLQDAPDHANALSYLPRDIPDFVGRTSAIDWLDSVANGSSETAIISAIADGGGMGKTALAVRWAHAVADRFPDGQLYIDLHGFTSGAALRPVEALTHLLICLGTPPSEIPTGLAAAAARYRALMAGRRMLVLLDNARAADQVRPLLPGGSDCLVVVTSRDGLSGLIARQGAQRLTLGPLPTMEAITLLRCLIDRRRTDAEPDAVVALAELCGGLPLALRIAAAHVADRPATSLAGYVQELSESGRLAALSIKDDEEFGLTSVLDHSFHALPPSEQEILTLLHMIPGHSFTCDVVAVLANLPLDKATQAMATLADGHLVECPLPGRFSLHDLIREYSAHLARVSNTDGEGPLTRLLDYYRHIVGQSYAIVRPGWSRAMPVNWPRPWQDLSFPGTVPEAVAWFSTERTNLTAAVLAAAELGMAEHTRAIVEPLWHLCHSQGGTTGWINTFEGILAVMDDDTPQQAASKTHVQHLLGNAYNVAGRHEEATEVFSRCIDTWSATGDRVGVARARSNLGAALEYLGRYNAALHELDLARATFRQESLSSLEAYLLSTVMPNVNRKLGKLTEARDNLLDALPVWRSIGADLDTARALNGLACVYLSLGEPATAMPLLEEGLRLARHVENQHMVTLLQTTVAEVLRDLGEHEQALTMMVDLIGELKDMGQPSTACAMRVMLGDTYRLMNRRQEGVDAYQGAITIGQELGLQHQVALAQLGMGLLSQAAEPLQLALSLLDKIGAPEAETARAALAEIGGGPHQMPDGDHRR